MGANISTTYACALFHGYAEGPKTLFISLLSSLDRQRRTMPASLEMTEGPDREDASRCVISRPDATQKNRALVSLVAYICETAGG